MIFQRYVGCHHPAMEWGDYESAEQFHRFIAADDREGEGPILRVRLDLDDSRNPYPKVNASNGLLDPRQLPIVIQLLEAAYDWWAERHPEEVRSAPVP